MPLAGGLVFAVMKSELAQEEVLAAEEVSVLMDAPEVTAAEPVALGRLKTKLTKAAGQARRFAGLQPRHRVVDHPRYWDGSLWWRLRSRRGWQWAGCER